MLSTFDHLEQYDPRRVNLLWFERVHKIAYVLAEPEPGKWMERFASDRAHSVDVPSDDAGVF